MTNTVAHEELAFIRKIMADSRTTVVDDGKPAIAWGILVAIGMAFTYIDALTEGDFNTWWIWIVITIAGWGYIFYEKARIGKREKVRTLAARILDTLWATVGISIGLVIALGIISPMITDKRIISPLAFCPLCAIILGIGYFTSGLIIGLKWVQGVGIAWWLSAIGLFLYPSVHSLIIYTGLMITLQVIPGIVLYRDFKRSISAQSASAQAA